MKKIAVIGDIHGCMDEFQELLKKLAHHSLDAVYHLGDLVDRGPASAEVVHYCQEHAMPGTMGNHEFALLNTREKLLDYGVQSLSSSRKERVKIIESIKDERDWAYLSALPLIHVEDDLDVVLVHGGLWPALALWQQPSAVLYARMIKPDKPGDTRWDEKPGEYTAAEVRAAGYVPWQTVCDLPQYVVYGHSVQSEPLIINRTIGIDTGCVYGGSLTAVILPTLEFVSVKAKRTWYRKFA